MKAGFVYMMANQKNGTIYTGVASSLPERIHAHREGLIDGFTKKHRIHLLVWFEFHATMAEAIAREKSIKEWPRAHKIALIEPRNPHWLDLYPALI